MATPIQLRRGTASLWTSVNPTLAEGEMGVELDTGKFKIGNGSNNWGGLAYSSTAPTLASLLTTLGIPTYSDMTAANLALEIGKPFYNTALTKLDITTA